MRTVYATFLSGVVLVLVIYTHNSTPTVPAVLSTDTYNWMAGQTDIRNDLDYENL